MPLEHLRLLLARHGQTEWNASLRMQGHSDIPLDMTGLAQAARLAPAILRALGDTVPQAVITSDLQRACQTAQVIRKALPSPQPPLLLDPRLREMHFGEWQGLTYAEMRQRDPQAMEAWEKDFNHTAPPGGETGLEFAARILEAYSEWQITYPTGTLVVVSHGGVLRGLLAHALGMAQERAWQFAIDNTAWCELNIYPEGALLNRFNDTHHLD